MKTKQKKIPCFFLRGITIKNSNFKILRSGQASKQERKIYKTVVPSHRTSSIEGLGLQSPRAHDASAYSLEGVSRKRHRKRELGKARQFPWVEERARFHGTERREVQRSKFFRDPPRILSRALISTRVLGHHQRLEKEPTKGPETVCAPHQPDWKIHNSWGIG